MKIRENITLYVCDYCKKRLIRKHAMEKHELHCSMNPANVSACSGCVFLQERKETIDTGGDDPQIVRTFNTFFCEKLNVGVYPHKAVKKGLIEKYPEQFEGQIKMPTTCKEWNWTKDEIDYDTSNFFSHAPNETI